MANNLTQYDRADWWDDGGPFSLLKQLNPGRFDFFGRVITNWRGVRVLDVGCGGGFVCEYLAQQGALVTGLDLSQAALERARAHSQRVGLGGITYVHGKGTELPFESDSFDVVVCVDVLEHIPEWPVAVREFARVLRPQGHFLFDTINRNPVSAWFFVSVLENLFGAIPRGTHDPKLFIRPSELKSVLNDNGFINVTTTGFHTLRSPLSRKYFAVSGGPQSLMYIGHAQLSHQDNQQVGQEQNPDQK